MSKLEVSPSHQDLATSVRVIELGATGTTSLGYLTVAEPDKNIPFEIQRVYWTYFTPHEVERGHHAHRELEQVLIAVSGHIHVTTESIYGEVRDFHLMSPQQGLFIPKLHWRTLKFSHSAVLVSLASLRYDPAEYIRDYGEFQELQRLFQVQPSPVGSPAQKQSD